MIPSTKNQRIVNITLLVPRGILSNDEASVPRIPRRAEAVNESPKSPGVLYVGVKWKGARFFRKEKIKPKNTLIIMQMAANQRCHLETTDELEFLQLMSPKWVKFIYLWRRRVGTSKHAFPTIISTASTPLKIFQRRKAFLDSARQTWSITVFKMFQPITEKFLFLFLFWI